MLKMLTHPPVEWAQRKDTILLTIQVEDCQVQSLDVQPDKLYFRGVGNAEKNTYECTLEFFKEVDPSGPKKIVTDRNIQLVISKKEKSEPFWPRLLKSSQKVHYVKVDFNKWRDEDEEEEEETGTGAGMGNWDLNDMMGQMGGMNPSDNPDLGDLEDSDNEDLPDLEENDEEEKKEGAGEEGSKTEEAAPAVDTEVAPTTGDN